MTEDDIEKSTDIVTAEPETGQVERVLDAVEAEDREKLQQELDELHPADVADILEQIDSADRAALLSLWSSDMVGDVLSELDEALREEVIEQLEPEMLGQAIRDLETDDVVDLVEDMDAEMQGTILDALEASERAAVEQALSYPEESAGRLMQREVVTAPEHWTVGDAIDFLRGHDDDLPEQFYHIILVDPKIHPVGYVSLGRMLGSPRPTLLRDIVEESFRTISVAEPEENVAYAFNQYHLISAPVVDENNRLVGVITIDDAMIVLDEEAEEDILLLAGVGEESLSDRVSSTVRARLPWLCVNLVTANVAAMVIAQFEGSIAKIVALAVLMPIVASMGGNAGTQSLTVAVRALATKDLTESNTFRVIRREALAGLLNGCFLALVMASIAFLWFRSPVLSAVIASAMVINMFVAGLAGVMVPVVLDRLKLDPAVASATFVTTCTDVVGFVSFLGLATIFLL
ncbi:magnesium transporter [Qingshengfaniella alkalisoli]|uniref:Magnesium transporter MgtE n=1 Tax=Qingshengfaniella alkalisoli TaxID=2599296 RepID=A0A5B8ISF4_9RHOB|nr:magnesium transporter [Qingshengfaniella alkalisoli]QDY69142.1 magnesium transporter [Qingshengfaniella alkalisoli]